MKVFLIGGGGREHALAWRLAGSEKCAELYCAPGNPGIEDIAECVAIPVDDVAGLAAFAQEKNIDFVVVGPEGPLVGGLVDRLLVAGIPAFGPKQAAAALEGSKGFTKDLCRKHNIPTAACERLTDPVQAEAFIRQTGAPIVIKADGLAAGKGVIIAQTVDEAISAAKDMLSGNSFGQAGHEIVVEEFLDGEELSFFALCDGESVLPFTTAQDHKRVGDGDTGPNTGGMGAYSPAHIASAELQQKIMDRIILPTVHGMQDMGAPFRGVFFAGIMVVSGEPYLIEYNARFGDPETQPMMLRLQDDLLDVLYACATGKLANHSPLNFSANVAMSVVMAAKGYPGTYEKGSVIDNITGADNMPGTKVFHAGTARNDKGEIVANGGRVLTVTVSAPDVREAQQKAYAAVDTIEWADGFCRRDIGWRAVQASQKP